MKYRFLSGCILLMIFCLGLSGISIAADDSLVLYLTFDEDQGKDVPDLSPHQNDAQIQGDPKREPGVFGDALRLNGSLDTIKVPHHESLDMKDAFTLEMWVNLDEDGGQDSEVGIEKGGWEAGEYSLYAHYMPGAGSAVQVMELPVDCGDANSGHLGPDLRDAQWHHLAGVWDSKTIWVYLDGEEVVSVDCKGGPLGSNQQPLTIGSRTGSARYLKGMVDEIRVYNRDLTQAEIKKDMETLGGLAVESMQRLTITWAQLKAE